MPTVSVPGLGNVEFPEGTSNEVMESAIADRLASNPPTMESLGLGKPVIDPFAVAAKAKETIEGPKSRAEIEALPPGLRQVANVGAGAGKFILDQVTPENALIGAGMMAGGPVVSAAGGLYFGAQAALDTIKRVPELWRLYQSGDYDELTRQATEAGLGAAVATLGLRHGYKAGKGMLAAKPAAAPAPDLEAAKTAQKVADVVAEHPEMAETAKETVEAAQVPVPPAPEGAPPIVKTPEGKKVIPNPPVDEDLNARVEEEMRGADIDPNDPKARAAYLAKFYGIKKPVNVNVGDVEVSSAVETPGDYQLNVPEGAPEKVDHEIQHARVQEGQIPGVPEGPGANDQIASSIASDISQRQTVPREINVKHLQTWDAVKDEIEARVKDLPEREVIPRSESLAGAMNLGFGIKDANALADGTTELHKQILAASNIVTGVTERYTVAREMAMRDPSNLEAKKAAFEAQKAILRTMEPFTRAGTNIARALSALGTERPGQMPSDIGGLLAELEKKGAFSEAIQQKLLETDMGDPASRQKLRKYLGMKGPSLQRKIGFYYLNSILSAIPTYGVKATSDLTSVLVAPFRTALSYPVKLGMHLIKPGEYAKPAPGEAAARIVGTVNSVNDAAYAFSQAIKGGTNLYQRDIPIGGMAGKIISTPVRILGAITDAFHSVLLNGELYERGYKNAINEGKSHAEAMKAARAMAQEPTAAELEEASEATKKKLGERASADIEARKDTLSSEPSQTTSAFLRFRNLIPGGVQVAPVVMVPTQLVHMAFEHTPFALYGLIRDFAAGKEITNARVGRVMLGGLVGAWAWNQAQGGGLTGAGPNDPREWRNLYNTGWRPDSLQLPNGDYVSLKALGPLGFMLGMIANVSEVAKEAPKHPDLEDFAKKVMDHIFRFGMEYPMVQGIANLFEAASNGKWNVALGRIAGGFVPSALSRLGSSLDESQRKIDTFWSAVQARIPLYREELKPKLGVRDQPLPEPGTPGERSLSPVVRSEAMTDSIADQAAAKANLSPLRMTIRIKGIDVPLTDEDSIRLAQLSNMHINDKFNKIDQAPSRFLAMSEQTQNAMIKKYVATARAQAQNDLRLELKKSGVYDTYAAAALGKAAVKAEPAPSLDPVIRPYARKAEDILDRYAVSYGERPSNVPEELDTEWQRNIDEARARWFRPLYANPAELGSLPPDRARELVEKTEKAAQDYAIKRTLSLEKKKAKAEEATKKAAVGAQ